MNTRLMDAVAVSYFLGPFVRHQTVEGLDASYELNSRLSETEVEELYGNPFAVKSAPVAAAAPASDRPRPQSRPRTAGRVSAN